MNHAEALRHLDGHINLEATAGAIHGLSLEHIQSVVGVLGDPQDAFKVIHVTGTNGKGSTARMITALLVEHGLTVGTYASPHLQQVNERIAWNGEPITDEQLAALVDRAGPAGAAVGHRAARTSSCSPPARCCSSPRTRSTWRWSRSGCSGATTPPTWSTPTSPWSPTSGRTTPTARGEWRQAIASEKAGIIKPDSFLVLGEREPDLQSGVPGRGTAGRLVPTGRLRHRRRPRRRRRPRARPAHPARRASRSSSSRCTAATRPTTRPCAVAAVEAFFDRPIEHEIAQAAFAGLTSPGRFEVMGHGPLVLIDGAHNPDGARAAADAR